MENKEISIKMMKTPQDMIIDNLQRKENNGNLQNKKRKENDPNATY
jgi:hypothetical protein